MNTAIAFLLFLTVCGAIPTSRTRGSGQDNYDQVMLSPRILPDEMYGPNYVWDNKGMPTRVEDKPPARQYYNVPPVNTPLRQEFEPHVIENALNILKEVMKPSDYRISFPDSEFASEPDDMEGLEQRMMGVDIPDKMHGPDYNWDTKGWPSLVRPSPTSVRYPVRNRVPQDNGVYFPGNDFRR